MRATADLQIEYVVAGTPVLVPYMLT